ncbi:unnamed protein product [Arctia plantaginis]|uniref:Uncharacterized protein n=1 Tax=Arctia plantaginis TaxID=874455 RepID=A0A8S1B405_ARCPL|nr:unnamed protein product [Arctia plantaginis]
MVKFRTVSLSALGVSTHDRLSDFYTSSWQRGESALPLLLVRLLLTSSALAILTWSLVEGASPYWLIYLTNWGLLLVSATMISGLALSFAFRFKKQIETTNLPWFVKSYWIFFNVTAAISIMITALYWILLYDPAAQEKLGLRALWLDISTHGLASCIIVVELFSSRTPIRLAHIYQPLFLGIWYAAFSGIYYAAGGTDRNGNVFIYAVLNWQEPRSTAIVVAGSVVAVVVLYVILWGFAVFRDKLSLTYVRTHNLPITPPDAKADRQMV